MSDMPRQPAGSSTGGQWVERRGDAAPGPVKTGLIGDGDWGNHAAQVSLHSDDDPTDRQARLAIKLAELNGRRLVLAVDAALPDGVVRCVNCGRFASEEAPEHECPQQHLVRKGIPPQRAKELAWAGFEDAASARLWRTAIDRLGLETAGKARALGYSPFDAIRDHAVNPTVFDEAYGHLIEFDTAFEQPLRGEALRLEAAAVRGESGADELLADAYMALIEWGGLGNIETMRAALLGGDQPGEDAPVSLKAMYGAVVRLEDERLVAEIERANAAWRDARVEVVAAEDAERVAAGELAKSRQAELTNTLLPDEAGMRDAIEKLRTDPTLKKERGRLLSRDVGVIDEALNGVPEPSRYKPLPATEAAKRRQNWLEHDQTGQAAHLVERGGVRLVGDPHALYPAGPECDGLPLGPVAAWRPSAPKGALNWGPVLEAHDLAPGVPVARIEAHEHMGVRLALATDGDGNQYPFDRALWDRMPAELTPTIVVGKHPAAVFRDAEGRMAGLIASTLKDRPAGPIWPRERPTIARAFAVARRVLPDYALPASARNRPDPVLVEARQHVEAAHGEAMARAAAARATQVALEESSHAARTAAQDHLIRHHPDVVAGVKARRREQADERLRHLDDVAGRGRGALGALERGRSVAVALRGFREVQPSSSRGRRYVVDDVRREVEQAEAEAASIRARIGRDDAVYGGEVYSFADAVVRGSTHPELASNPLVRALGG
mgnify:CR=1 FL=1